MRRSLLMLALGAAGLTLACDRGVSSTVRLSPSPVPRPAAGLPGPDSAHTRTVAALDALATQLGFRVSTIERAGDCIRTWRRDAPGLRDPSQLYLCARALPRGQLEVRISELFTTAWSPLGEQVRRGVADTLARYGTVDTLRTP